MMLKQLIVLGAYMAISVKGQITISPSSKNISHGDAVDIHCKGDAITSVAFHHNGDLVGSCFNKQQCTVTDEFEQNITVHWNKANGSFVLSISSITDSVCGAYSCLSNTHEAKTTISYSDFRQLIPQQVSEPGEYTMGVFKVMSGCFLLPTGGDIKMQWYTIDSDNQEEEEYFPTNLTSAVYPCGCSNECNGQGRQAVLTTFPHMHRECEQTKSVFFKFVATSTHTGHVMSWTSLNRHLIKYIPKQTTSSATPTEGKNYSVVLALILLLQYG